MVKRRSKRRSRRDVVLDFLDEVEAWMIYDALDLDKKRRGGRDYVA